MPYTQRWGQNWEEELAGSSVPPLWAELGSQRSMGSSPSSNGGKEEVGEGFPQPNQPVQAQGVGNNTQAGWGMAWEEGRNGRQAEGRYLALGNFKNGMGVAPPPVCSKSWAPSKSCGGSLSCPSLSSFFLLLFLHIQ